MTKAECFKAIFETQINREGAAELLEWLKSTDFFTAPASTKHHGAYPGGLVDHSLNVYYALIGNYRTRDEYSGESHAIVALLHDVCKAEYYSPPPSGRKTRRGSGRMCRAGRSRSVCPWDTGRSPCISFSST